MPVVNVGDITTYYEVHGDGEPLVFIGGLGADISLYAALLDDLARCHRVIAFDNRGAGRTSKPDAPYSIGLFADDTLGLLDALGLDVVDLVGMSMGGRIALELAATHPDRVRRLVLISTSAAGTGNIHMSIPMHLVSLMKRIPGLQGRYPQPEYAHQRQRVAATTYNGTDRMCQVTCPTLIMHGRRDRSIPLERARDLNNAISGSYLRVFGGGHMFSLLSQRHEAVQTIDAFLA